MFFLLIVNFIGYNGFAYANETNQGFDYQINIGDYIEFGTYNGDSILWQVIDFDNDGDPLLFSEYIISLKSFDSSGDYFTDSVRKSFGSNEWENSNLRQWLNSSDNEIQWLQNPPSDENAWGNPYDTENGFLGISNFTAPDRNCIKPVVHKYVTVQENSIGGSELYKRINWKIDYQDNYKDAYYQMITDKVFLLSAEEIVEKLYQKGFEWRAFPTPKAVDNSKEASITIATDETVSIDLNEHNYWWYWTRTAEPSYPEVVNYVDFDGRMSNATLAASGFGGVRPALYLDLSQLTLNNGNGTKSNPFQVESIDKPDFWAEKEINTAISNGLIPNEQLNKFKSNITREEFCDLIVNLIVVKTGKSIDELIVSRGLNLNKNPFTDTSSKNVIIANQLGIVNGKEKNKFEPQVDILREEAAVMLLRAAKVFIDKEVVTQSRFGDQNNISSWAVDSINYVSAMKIMSGVDANSFLPKTNYTKQQAFITIQRLFNSLSTLTELDKVRLKSYAYYEYQPMMACGDFLKVEPESALYLKSNGLKDIIELNKSQNFITSEDTIYTAWNSNYVSRGILQEIQSDGKILEQDIEYEYFYGYTTGDIGPTPSYHLVDIRLLK